MEEHNTYEPLLELFLYESDQLIEQLENIIMDCEKEGGFPPEAINEIFRIMHTIKGSASMMVIQNIARLAHAVEDIFYQLRENRPGDMDNSELSELVLICIDFFKQELQKIKNKEMAVGNPEDILTALKIFLDSITVREHGSGPENPKLPEEILPEASDYHYYRATIYFEDGCEMENIRAFTIIRDIKQIADEVYSYPEDVIEDEDSIPKIRREGFRVYAGSRLDYERMQNFLLQTVFLKELELELLQDKAEFNRRMEEETGSTAAKLPQTLPIETKAKEMNESVRAEHSSGSQQSLISVNVHKLDYLMDLVGELVIAEAMVIQNPELAGLELRNFDKASRQLHKITSEIQDVVMSIRMVPLSITFHKMHRVVRDMNKKLSKEIRLTIIGEETEVDKNIIEHISDPLMHLVRNAADHGIEDPEDRQSAGKPRTGTITLEAKSTGREVLIIVRDDGKGLDKNKILDKARKQRLLFKPAEDMTDREIYNLVLLPGFSTKEQVSEYSGRGVGMDVAMKNIETVGGSISVDSTAGKGTTVTLKIPLTLAIIDGMNIGVGQSCYTIPITSVKESFRPKDSDIFCDPDNNEMIMVRGQCYQIRRLHELFGVETAITRYSEGIIIMLEQDGRTTGIFADELLGNQQVVVKALPAFIKSFKRTRALSGCTLLGDGSISLILDVPYLVSC